VNALRLQDLMPSDTPPYMFPAWLGCLSWAVSEPAIMAAFRAETGNHWQPGRSGIERMIDEATGAQEQFVIAFARWVNANVWGPMDVPGSALIGEEP